MKQGIIVFFVIAFTVSLNGQQKETENFLPPENPIEITAIKTTEKITIDGKLEELAWEKSTLISDFFRREPRQGGKIKYKTEVKFLYDDKNLYVGAFCKDSLGFGGIRVQDLRRDFGWGENDIFGIALDAQNLKQFAQGFQTTPYGNQRDFQNFNGNSFDNSWNTLWKVRTKRTANGYYVEMAIPFKSLRYNLPKDGNTIEIGFTLVRYARREVEVSSFPAIPQSFTPYRMTYAARLTGIEAPPPSTNIRIEPYALYQYNDTKTGGTVTDKLNEPKVGGDAKWVINPKMVLDVTMNTDFAQADVDRAVNNLDRFNIFFPERRQFFLENSGIWAGSSNNQVKPFFSRTIGLSNSFNAQPAPIEFGSRFTSRTEKNTIGALVVRQGATEDAGASTFGVFRYTQNYAKENNFGVMATYRLDDSFTKKDTETSSVLSRKDNTTITVDGLIRPKPELTFSYMLSTSFDSEVNGVGYSGRITAGKRTNKMYLGYTNTFVSDNYNSDMGFVFQKDVMTHNPGGYAILRPKKWSFIRRWDPGVFASYNHDVKDFGNFQQGSLYIFPIYMWFKDNSFFEVSISPTWQNINFNFAPLGITIDENRYEYTRYFIRYNTDQSKKFSFYLSHDFGDFYNGSRTTSFGRLLYNPLPNISISGGYEHNNIKSLGAQNEDLKTDLYSANLRLALNPRVQFNSFYQYNSFDKQGRWNLRFSWEYQPLSFIYLVFNDTQTDAFNPIQTQTLGQTQFISKITFLKQF